MSWSSPNLSGFGGYTGITQSSNLPGGSIGNQSLSYGGSLSSTYTSPSGTSFTPSITHMTGSGLTIGQGSVSHPISNTTSLTGGAGFSTNGHSQVSGGVRFNL